MMPITFEQSVYSEIPSYILRRVALKPLVPSVCRVSLPGLRNSPSNRLCQTHTHTHTHTHRPRTVTLAAHARRGFLRCSRALAGFRTSTDSEITGDTVPGCIQVSNQCTVPKSVTYYTVRTCTDMVRTCSSVLSILP